jgi:DeoR/GlpR family transcriptional regulator of sugar metabolism
LYRGAAVRHVVDNMAVEAPIKQAMIAAADQVVLLATEAKFGTALRLCALSDGTPWSRRTAPTPRPRRCRNAGGQVIIA